MSIQNNQNNPDVLNCLANLSNDEIFTPTKLATQILDTLPKNIWSNPNIKFLDPCSKTGIFLREIANRLNIGLKDIIKNDKKRSEHIFLKQIYGISITELTGLISRRSIYYSKNVLGKNSICDKFPNKDGNIYYKETPHSWNKKDECKHCGAKRIGYDRSKENENYAYPFLHDENLFKNMKFDVIIGNPPYQLEDGGFGKSASPIYHKFVEQAMRLNPTYLSMIIPARWYAGGKGLDDFRKKMLNDERISEIHDFPQTSDCFPGLNIRGGICYFLWDKNHKGNPNIINYKNNKVISSKRRNLKIEDQDIFVRYNQAINILNKIEKFKEEKFYNFVSSRKPFGLPTNYTGFNKNKNQTYNIELYRFGENGYINANQAERNKELINEYKIFVSKASPGGDEYPHQVISEPLIGSPGTCCTETYILIGPFKNKTICENVVNYMKTKFFRFLMILIKNTQDVPKKVYSFIPNQNFNEKWTDEKLFKKYKITKEEIEFIDTLVRPFK